MNAITRTVRFELNGREVEAMEHETIIQVAEREGVDVPRLCYKEGMEAVGIETIYIYLRDEYHGCRALLEQELERLRADPPMASMPPQYSSISSRTVMPAGASLTPGSRTRPETENERRPLRPLRPWPANQSAPFSTMSRTQCRVSKLCSSVGRPNRPTCAT